VNKKPDKSNQIKEAIAKSPTFKKMKEMDTESKAKWESEIAALENRVYTEVFEVDLGNGTVIAIRTHLNDFEARRVDELEKAQKDEQNADKRALMLCEIIELITQNPLITKEWLMQNRDKYSPVDVMSILLGFREVRLKERMRHVAALSSAATFRPNEPGAVVRELSPLHEDSRSS
jgi:hypothetical protein